MLLARRNFLIGLGAAFAAPAIVRASSLMKLPPAKPKIIAYHVYAYGTGYTSTPTITFSPGVPEAEWRFIARITPIDSTLGDYNLIDRLLTSDSSGTTQGSS